MGPLRRARRVISIHAPRVGSDTTAYVIGGYPAKFQSTLPAWGATSIVPSARSTLHFNPRSPRGERLTLPSSCSSSKGFQSTLPAWGATPDGRHTRRDRRISIHAPRVGSDSRRCSTSSEKQNFNPRSPRGERPRAQSWRCTRHDFNPRSPRGERRSGSRRPSRSG